MVKVHIQTSETTVIIFFFFLFTELQMWELKTCTQNLHFYDYSRFSMEADTISVCDNFPI